MNLTIQYDSREKARAITKIIEEFDRRGVKHFVSKLYVGDYASLDNPRLVIDRKQNLTEICANVCQNHDRFRRELIRAQENGIKLIILIEHSNQIRSIDDVAGWQNPRLGEPVWIPDRCVGKGKAEHWVPGHWSNKHPNAMTGETLSKIMRTMEQKYGCEFQFCDKLHTGKRIIELLGGDGL